MDTNFSYSLGDWVVHSYYGLGQIMRIEDKPLQDVDTPCYKVKTKDSTYWFPTTGTRNPRIRPVASEAILDNVIRTLRSEASTLNTDRMLWKKMIEDVQAENELLSISALVRDLSAQQVIRNLNQIERDALSHNKEQLLLEWALIVPEEIEEIRSRLSRFIHESQSNIDVPDKRK